MTATQTDIIVDETPEAKAAFLAQLREFEGVQIGDPTPGPDPVNTPMVRHLVETLGDKNPIYVDEAAAAASIHGGLVAPPTMLQAWVMTGIEGPTREGDGPYVRLTNLLYSRGFTSVVATNSEQTYNRYLRPGDRLTMKTVIDSISEEKTTGLGTGHFVTTRQDYYDADGELVGSMLFRIIRFRPKARAPKRPNRPEPSITHDNEWWFTALSEGRLLAQRCSDCGRTRFPPGPMCPSCHSLAWGEAPLAGTGVIHSFVVAHFPQVPSFEYPLPIVLVDIPTADGEATVRMVMNTADTERDAIQIGATVRIDIRQADENGKLPFAIVDAAPTNGASS